MVFADILGNSSIANCLKDSDLLKLIQVFNSALSMSLYSIAVNAYNNKAVNGA